MRCGHSWQWTVGTNLVGRMRTDLSCYSVMFEAVEAVEAFPEAIAFLLLNGTKPAGKR